MYFMLAKTVGSILLPSNAVGVLCVLGALLLMTRYRRAGVCFTLGGACLLAVFGWSPVSNWMLLPLTERFPRWQESSGPPDGIIVLGGAIDSEASAARGALETDNSAERLFAMLDLARRYPQARLVYSGGSGNLLMNSVPEAPFAGRLLEQFGLSAGRVVLEERSRTTEENARLTREVVIPLPGQRWLLVTSAFHMPRSIGLYRKAGFDVEAFPVDFRSRGWADAPSPFDRLSGGLARGDVAMHEWIGLAAAWLAGRSDELLPGPRSR